MTHFLLPAFVACTLHARLPLFFAFNQGVVFVANAAGAAFDGTSFPLNRAMMM